MSKSEFIVIAGPNGAGKSTFSSEILRSRKLIAFDWDIEFENLWKSFGYDPLVIEGVRSSVNEKFEDFINLSIQNKVSFSFETNFHTDFPIGLCKKVQKLGFDTVLIFVGVDSIEKCQERVDLRVKTGGHYVDIETIKYRHSEGLKNLKNALNLFDRVHIFDSSKDYDIYEIVSFDAGRPVKQDLNLPDYLGLSIQ